MHFRTRIRLALLLAALLPAAPSRADETSGPPTVGTVTLEACEAAAPDGWCGSIERPLDPSGTVPGTIRIGFEWYPHRVSEVPAAGTMVAVQRGPGFATTGARRIFREILAQTLWGRDLLLLDLRGTGTSGAIDCPALQQATVFDPAAASDCARLLGPGASFYGTMTAADDLAALLDALAIERVDLYGVSYGTVFGQVFALRHADRLRSLVLDGAVALGTDLLDRAEGHWRTFERAFDTVCKRSAACTPVGWRAGLRQTLAAIRAGAMPASVDASDLLDMMMSTGHDGIAYRELAAAMAASARGDRTPLLRLVGASASDETFAQFDPAMGSAGSNLAVACLDLPMLFAWDADADTRRAQAEAAVEAFVTRRAAAFAPFRIPELLEDPEDSGLCADWPTPPQGLERLGTLPPGGPFPPVPTLVLSGELDTVTPPALGAAVAARMPGAIHLVVRNALHGTAKQRSWLTPLPGDRVGTCVVGIIARFVVLGDTGDTGCLAERPAPRIVADFPRRLADVAPAEPGAGPVDPADLRLAASVAAAVGDAVAHFGPPSVPGLRGGAEDAYWADGGYSVQFRDVRWVEDVVLNGWLQLDSEDASVTGSFSVAAPDGVTGLLSVGWVERGDAPVAVVTGTLEGGTLGPRSIFTRVPAP